MWGKGGVEMAEYDTLPPNWDGNTVQDVDLSDLGYPPKVTHEVLNDQMEGMGSPWSHPPQKHTIH
jgi:hypothetical protein